MRRGTDYIGVGVGAIIVDERGRLFLARRGPNAKNERGLWEFPGGSVELGERLADALRREIREEYGVEIEVGEPVIREPEKCSEIGWFAPSQVPPALTVISRENLENYIKLKDRTPANEEPWL